MALQTKAFWAGNFIKNIFDIAFYIKDTLTSMAYTVVMVVAVMVIVACSIKFANIK
jgi:hypothetical protein